MRQVTFNIPTNNGLVTVRGLPAYFTIGGRRIRFMLQYDSDNKIRHLTHFASGMKFGSLNTAEVELTCNLSPYHRFSKRRLAQFLIDKAVARLGADKVLASIDAAKVING